MLIRACMLNTRSNTVVYSFFLAWLNLFISIVCKSKFIFLYFRGKGF